MPAGSLRRLVIDSADIDESEKSWQRDATLRDSEGNRLVMSPMGQ
jgi:hypothetical protein